MRFKSFSLTLILILFLLAGQVFAGSDLRVGTAGAQELRIPVGARGSAMGGSAVADIYGVEALYWNPAGVAIVEGTEVAFSYLRYIADINMGYMGVTRNLGDYGSFGFSVKILDIGEIEATSETSPRPDLTTGEIFSPSFAVLGLTYSKQISMELSFGVTGMYVHEKIWQETASGLAFDLGFIYNPGWKGLRFGGVMKNFGPDMRFDGPQFEKVLADPDLDPNAPRKPVRTQSASFELPSYVQLGISWDLYDVGENRVTTSSVFQSNNFNRDEFKAGFEYSYNDMISLRGGYTSDLSEKEKILGTDEETKQYLYGLTLGLGLKTKLGNTEISFDYTWMQTEFFDDNQFFTLKFGF